GITVIALGASLLINDPNDIVLDTRSLNNFGSTVFTGNRWDFYSGATFNNEVGGSFDAQSDAGFNNFGSPSTFNNAGTFTKSAGSGTLAIYSIFNNSGSVQVLSGTLSLPNSGTIAFDGSSVLASSSGTTIQITSSMLGNTTDAALFS